MSAKPRTYLKKFKVSNLATARRIEKTNNSNQAREILIEDDSSQTQLNGKGFLNRRKLNKSTDCLNRF